MPLVGGGGAPNVAGTNPAGTGSGLNYLGRHAYAYSGGYSASTSAVTALEFTTGNEYVAGVLTLNSATHYETANIAGAFVRVQVNGETIATAYSGNGANDSPSSAMMDLIFAPMTHVKVEIWADNNAASSIMAVQYTGRVYQ
jgi:hypothetical protein